MNLFYYESKFKIKICWGGGGGVGGGTAWGARVSDFFYKESKSNKKFFFGGGGRCVGGGEGGVVGWRGVAGRTDKQAQTNLPLQRLPSWGITMHKCTNYGPDKLNL